MGILGLAVPACGGPSEPQVEDADTHILFVGNSLTFANGMPGMVTTIARTSGLSVATTSIVAPNFSLEDHWRSGLAVVESLFDPPLTALPPVIEAPADGLPRIELDEATAVVVYPAVEETVSTWKLTPPGAPRP